METFLTQLCETAAIGDRHLRAAAVERLRRRVSLSFVMAAARLLAESEDYELRRAAAEVLGADIGDGLSAERLEDVAQMADDEAERLEAVAIELGRSRSVDAIPVLGVMAAHDDPIVRGGAAAGLGELARIDSRALAALRYLAGDDDADVRNVARRGLGIPQVV